MNARKCDRCGAFYVPEKDKKIYVLIWRGITGEQKMDLCPLCSDDLRDFAESYKDRMEGKKEE